MKRDLLILFTILSLVSCKPRIVTDSIELSEYQLEYDVNGGDAQIEVNATSFWKCAIVGEWITVKKISEERCSLWVSANDSSFRKGAIHFICHTDTATLQITQAHKDTLAVSTDSLSFTYKGGSANIRVQCFDGWSIKSKSDWIQTDINEGAGPTTINIKVAESENTEERLGGVVIASDEKEVSIKIHQQAKPFIKLEKESIQVDGDGGYISVLYLTNTDVDIRNSSSWIRCVHHDTLTRKLRMEILRNNIHEPREDIVKFVCRGDTSIYSTLTILQGEKIDHPALSFEEGYNLDISTRDTITLHPVFTDMTDSTLIWKSSSPETASVNQNGEVTVHRSGECKISITNPHHNISAEISLNIRLIAQDMYVKFDRQDMNTNPTAVRFPGEVLTVHITMDPEDSYSDDIVCISTDPEVARTDGRKIKCIAPGITTIVIESQYHQIRKNFKLIIIE